MEDNDETRHVLERVLSISGYTPVSLSDAVKALHHLRAGNPVSLIVLDMHLPGMDGRAFLAEVKKDPRLGQIPVVAFTGDPTAVPEAAVLVRKGSDDPDVLLDAIADCLRAA